MFKSETLINNFGLGFSVTNIVIAVQAAEVNKISSVKL